MFFRLLDRVPWMTKYKMHPEELAVASEQDLTPPRHAVYSLIAYLGPLFMFDVLLPRRALPIEAPCLSRLVFEVLLSLLVYDFLFFWLHLAFHKVGAVNRLVRHQKHHSKTPLDATQVVNHSLLDGTLQVPCTYSCCLHSILTSGQVLTPLTGKAGCNKYCDAEPLGFTPAQPHPAQHCHHLSTNRNSQVSVAREAFYHRCLDICR